MIPKDKLGKDIVVGSYIAYGHALGRCAGLRIGKVLAIKHIPKSNPHYYGSEWRITVRGVDDDWSPHSPMELCKKNGTLQFPDRIVVLLNVPDVYVALLENAR